jgi:capsular exopolysaccharide synthesis family protein
VGLSHYVRALLRRWYVVVAGLLVGGGLAVGLLQAITPQYESNIQLFVSASGVTDLASATQSNEFSQQRTASYAQLLQGRDLAAEVVADLGLERTPEELIEQLTVQVLPETVLLDVTVTDPSPERALSIAESIGRQFRAFVDDLETPAGAAAPSVEVSVVATPQLPREPSSPVPAQIVLGGLLLGTLAGAAVAVIRDRLDTSIRTEGDITAATGTPTLGVIPDGTAADLAAADRGEGPIAEAYRLVRTNLQFVSVDTHPRVLMVTSAEQGDGKTTTAIQLAQVLTRAGRRVLLVEADLRRPRVTDYMGLIGGAGLTNILTRTAEIEDLLQPVGDGTLTVLAAGPIPPNPSELLASGAMRDFLTTVASSWDMVVVDAAPLLPVADSGGLATLVDGVILVARWGRTAEDDLRRSTEMLDRAAARLLGCVLTFVPRRATSYAYGYGQEPAGRLSRVRERWKTRATTRRPPPIPVAREASPPGSTEPSSRGGFRLNRGKRR